MRIPIIAVCMLPVVRCFVRKPSALLSMRRCSTGHQPNSDVQLSPDDEAKINEFRERQSKVPRPTFAQEVKTLIDQSIGYGVLSTNSAQFEGYPTGSVVGFQTDERGLPFFSFSSMSAHTSDLVSDGRSSLTIMAKNFQGAAEGRVVLIGNIAKVTNPELTANFRSKYLERHKDAYWIKFGYRFMQ